VKGLIPPNTILDDPDSLPRVPSYTTLLLAHAFRALFYPSSFLYPLTARFLLQRPTLDSGDVPMLFAMLYSSDEEWRKERGWIVRFLADGMTGSSEDWRVFKRRHTWDLLASLFQSEARDRVLRHGILDVRTHHIDLCVSGFLIYFIYLGSPGSYSKQICSHILDPQIGAAVLD
jgi:nucleolar pre-ribosomal-associated protein 1